MFASKRIILYGYIVLFHDNDIIRLRDRPSYYRYNTHTHTGRGDHDSEPVRNSVLFFGDSHMHAIQLNGGDWQIHVRRVVTLCYYFSFVEQSKYVQYYIVWSVPCVRLSSVHTSLLYYTPS